MMLLGAVVLGVLIGCDRAARYEVLTFFFEGVPPLDGTHATAGADANVVILTNANIMSSMNPEHVVLQPDQFGQRVSSNHEFVRDCAQCHTGGFSSSRQDLRQDVPALCYSCHTDLHEPDDSLHGPLNVGECVFCHDPHQSAYVRLQKLPQPALCYSCHKVEDIVSIPGHAEPLQQACTGCHDPHGSSIPPLLKTSRRSDIQLVMD